MLIGLVILGGLNAGVATQRKERNMVNSTGQTIAGVMGNVLGELR